VHFSLSYGSAVINLPPLERQGGVREGERGRGRGEEVESICGSIIHRCVLSGPRMRRASFRPARSLRVSSRAVMFSRARELRGNRIGRGYGGRGRGE
jgi:hypothetical protein